MLKRRFSIGTFQSSLLSKSEHTLFVTPCILESSFFFSMLAVFSKFFLQWYSNQREPNTPHLWTKTIHESAQKNVVQFKNFVKNILHSMKGGRGGIARTHATFTRALQYRFCLLDFGREKRKNLPFSSFFYNPLQSVLSKQCYHPNPLWAIYPMI